MAPRDNGKYKWTGGLATTSHELYIDGVGVYRAVPRRTSDGWSVYLTSQTGRKRTHHAIQPGGSVRVLPPNADVDDLPHFGTLRAAKTAAEAHVVGAVRDNRTCAPDEIYALPASCSWPIQDQAHALKAIRYMAARFGKPAQYPKIRRAIKEAWGDDPEVATALKALQAGARAYNRVVKEGGDEAAAKEAGKAARAAVRKKTQVRANPVMRRGAGPDSVLQVSAQTDKIFASHAFSAEVAAIVGSLRQAGRTVDVMGAPGVVVIGVQGDSRELHVLPSRHGSRIEVRRGGGLTADNVQNAQEAVALFSARANPAPTPAAVNKLAKMIRTVQGGTAAQAKATAREQLDAEWARVQAADAARYNPADPVAPRDNPSLPFGKAAKAKKAQQIDNLTRLFSMADLPPRSAARVARAVHKAGTINHAVLGDVGVPVVIQDSLIELVRSPQYREAFASGLRANMGAVHCHAAAMQAVRVNPGVPFAYVEPIRIVEAQPYPNPIPYY